MNYGKRTFDIVVTMLGLIPLFPLMAAIATLILVMDGSPVIFRQERIGHNGGIFRILKFRTMVKTAESQGRQLTAGDDPRITHFGGWLRRSKLDELPQLFNVLKGDMSLVGPRPEVPRYVAHYTEVQRSVLALYPGITDPASIEFRAEAAILARHDDPETAYMREIMPEKIRIELSYARRRTWATDVGILLKTVWLLWR